MITNDVAWLPRQRQFPPALLTANITTSAYSYHHHLISHSAGGKASPSKTTEAYAVTMATLATLADELLNDFEDSGSEVDDHDQNGILADESAQRSPDDGLRNGRAGSTPGMELDGDEEEAADDEDALAAQFSSKDLKDAPDEDETKARVEKMKLGAVSDVRNVAGLMKTLQPVLEVRFPLWCCPPHLTRPCLHLHL